MGGKYNGKEKKIKETVPVQQLCEARNEQRKESVQATDEQKQVHWWMHKGEVQESHQGMQEKSKGLLIPTLHHHNAQPIKRSHHKSRRPSPWQKLTGSPDA